MNIAEPIVPITLKSRVWAFGGATGNGDIQLLGFDWSTALASLQVRAAPGTWGDPIIGLNSAPPGSEGISISYDAGMVDPDTSAVVGGSTIRLQIDATTMAAVDWGQTPTDEPLKLWYDLIVTPPSASVPEYFCGGPFIIYPGVTF